MKPPELTDIRIKIMMIIIAIPQIWRTGHKDNADKLKLKRLEIKIFSILAK